MITDFALTEIEWGNAMTEKGQVHAFQIKIYIVKILIRIQFDSTAVHNRFIAHSNAKLIVPINSKLCVGCMCVCALGESFRTPSKIQLIIINERVNALALSVTQIKLLDGGKFMA